MPSLGDKLSPFSHPAKSESSTKGYMRSTAESRNKDRHSNVNPRNQEKKRSPLKSPRLCQEVSETCYLHDFISKKELKENYDYHPQKYDDQEQTQWRENETYTQTTHHGELLDLYDYRPRPPSGDRSPMKSRKQRLVAPQTPEKFEECLGEAERASENVLISGDKRAGKAPCKHKIFEYSIIEKEHKQCKVKLAVKDKEINKLKGLMDKMSKPLTAKMTRYEEKQSKTIDDLQRKVKLYEDDLLSAKSKLKEEEKRVDLLVHQKQEKEDALSEMRIKHMRLRKDYEEYKKVQEVLVEREKGILEQQTKFGKICKEFGKYKEVNDALSIKNKELEERIRKLQTKLNQLEKVGETYKEFLKERDKQLQYIRELMFEVEAHEKDKVLLKKDLCELNCSYNILKAENVKVKSLQTELDAKTEEVNKLTRQLLRAESLHLEVRSLQREKGNAEQDNSMLRKVLQTKDDEIESLRKRWERSEERLLILNKERNNIQLSKRQDEDERLQQLSTENSSLKSSLTLLNLERENLLKECEKLRLTRENSGHEIAELEQTVKRKKRENEELNARAESLNLEVRSLQREKENAEQDNSKMRKVLQTKDDEIESLRKHWERSEERLLSLNKEMDDIQISKIHDEDERLQQLLTENSSLKTSLTRLNVEKENLLKECEKLRLTRENSEHEITELEQTVERMKRENEELNARIDGFSKKFSALHKEKEEEHAMISVLTSALHEKEKNIDFATNELERYKDLLKESTDLQEYKTVAENKISTLQNFLQEKETKIESLSKQLARSKENVSMLSKDIKEIEASKRQVADEKLQSLQTENATLKSALSKADNEIKDLLNKDSNLQEYKKDAENKIIALLNALQERETEIESLSKQLARSDEHVSILSEEIKNVQASERQAADEKFQSLQTENDTLKLAMEYGKTKNNELLKNISKLKKDKESAVDERDIFDKALDMKEKEIKTMHNELARYKEEILILSKNVEDLQGSKHQAAEENIKGLQKKINSLESELRSTNREMDDLSHKYENLKKFNENAEATMKKLRDTVQKREKEIEGLIEELAKANENLDREEQIAAARRIQELEDKNASLKSDLAQVMQETEKKVSALTMELKNLKKSKGTNSEENYAQLHKENEFLKMQLDRTSRSYEQLRKDYNEVKREKDHALNRLSSVAGEKLRNNNPGIADLSDENRPINLGEKFSQLYDDQWTDAIENLEQMHYSETDGIRCLLDILKAVFDECIKVSDVHFNRLKELTGTSHLSNDQLKKLKDLRKATAIHSVANTKQLVNDHMSKTFSKEKAACQTYIDRSIELCWLMSVQDPPVVIDFTAVHGQAIDDKILRKFTKTGSKIDFLVWPVIRLHEKGPLLQKGVVQPI